MASPHRTVLGFALIVCISSAATAADPEDELQAIFADWNARQDAVRSFRFTWTTEKLVPQGSLPRPPDYESPHPPPGAVIPPRDVTLDCSYTYAIDGSRARLVIDGEQWSPNENRLYTFERTRVWDGETNKSFFTGNIGNYPRGVIEAGPAHFMFRQEGDLWPLNFVLRPLAPAFSDVLDVKLLRLTDRVAVVDGRECVILERILSSGARMGGPQRRYELWLDRSRMSIPLRFLSYFGGQPAQDLKIAYRPDPVVGWVPESWNLHQFNAATSDLVQSKRAAVTDYALNPQLAAETFTLEYPNGTFVGDKRGGGKPSFYVIRLDGTRRDLRPGESGADYARLVKPGAPPPGQPAAGADETPIRVLVAANAITLAVLGIAVWWRRRLRRRSSES